ncbi:DUF87 domain-containing protein [Mesorhizobium sp. M1143]|uniref:ATP-binding protein n=1 Tax=Mesorhizobium sp. M1143 TaxID=2957061 RepID=UPI00333D2A79
MNDKIAAAAVELERTANDNGGAYEEPAVYKGSVARTMFDRPGSEDGTVTVLVPEKNVGNVCREAFVRIPSIDPRTGNQEAEYLGVVSSGPFAEPDALSPTASTLIVAAAHSAVFTPGYHGIANVEIFGERVAGEMVPPVRRPCPNSPVFLLPNDDVRKVLGLNIEENERPFRLGLLDGVSGIAIEVPAAKKSVLFKHTAILGTTGGGKSTTVSGMIASLAAADNAVVVFDTEGEYTTINEPTQNPRMLAALTKRGLQAKGVSKTALFHLAGRKTANPAHPNKHAFKIAFDDLSPHVLMEILDLSEPQERRLIDAYDICKVVMRQLGIYPQNDAEKNQSLDIDDLQSGWPRMTIHMIFDIVNLAMEYAGGTANATQSPEFKDHEDDIRTLIKQRPPEKDKRSWMAIYGVLNKMRRAKIFADRPADRLTAEALVKPGLVSIIDLSDMDAPYLRNMVIAQLLRTMQAHQDHLYKEFEERDDEPDAGLMTRVNIFIEEAHEFLSAERIRQMPNLFDQVARIARRGRKRYLGLVFITQLPSHLPDEVLGSGPINRFH